MKAKAAKLKAAYEKIKKVWLPLARCAGRGRSASHHRAHQACDKQKVKPIAAKLKTVVRRMHISQTAVECPASQEKKRRLLIAKEAAAMKKPGPTKEVLHEQMTDAWSKASWRAATTVGLIPTNDVHRERRSRRSTLANWNEPRRY